MQQNINFEFLFKHLRVQLDQYKVSTDPSVHIHNNLGRMTDCNFDQKNKWTNSYHCVYLMMTMNYWPIAQKEIGVLFCMFLYSVSFEFWGGFGFFFSFLLEYSCSTVLCLFQLYSKVNQLYLHISLLLFRLPWASLVAQRLKRLPPMRETQARSLGWEDPLEKEMATHSSILPWRIPWMEEPGRLQSMGLQRVGHN